MLKTGYDPILKLYVSGGIRTHEATAPALEADPFDRSGTLTVE